MAQKPHGMFLSFATVVKMKVARNKGLFIGFVVNALIVTALAWIMFKRERISEEIRLLENKKRDIAVLIQSTVGVMNAIGNQAKGYAFTRNQAFLLDLNQEVIQNNSRALKRLCISEKHEEQIKRLEDIWARLVKVNFRIIDLGEKDQADKQELYEIGKENTELVFESHRLAFQLQEDEALSYNEMIKGKNALDRRLTVAQWILVLSAFMLLFVVYFLINFYFRVRKQAEQSLSESRSLLQSVIDNSSTPIFIKHVNGQYLLVNREYENLVRKHGLQGRTDYEVLPHETADHLRETDIQIVKTGKEMRYEDSFLANGFKRTYLMLKFPVRDAANRIIAVGGIATDITEHKQHDELLKESEAQIKTIFNSGPDAIIVINENGNVIRWNPKAEELFKYKAEEIMDKPMHEFIMPERFHEAHIRGMRHFLKSGEGPILNKTIEVRAMKKNREEFDIELTISASKAQDKFIFIAFAREITNRKKLERDVLEYKNFLNSIIQNIPDVVYVKDSKDLRLVLFNKALEKFLGMTRNELLGKNDYDILPREQADFSKEKDNEVLQKAAMVEVAEEALDTKAGRRWLHTKKIPIMDESGKPKFLLGISRDITEWKKLENDRNKAAKQLRENEERMAMILENIGEGVVVANMDNRIVLSNLMAEDIFETDTIDSIDWSEYWNIYYPDGKTIFPAQKLPLERALRGEVTDTEIVLQDPETKKKKLLQVTGRPIKNEKGDVIAAVATIKDITKVKRLEKALEESRKLIGFGRSHHDGETEKDQKEKTNLNTEQETFKKDEELEEDKTEHKKIKTETENKTDTDIDKNEGFDIHRLPPPDNEE